MQEITPWTAVFLWDADRQEPLLAGLAPEGRRHPPLCEPLVHVRIGLARQEAAIGIAEDLMLLSEERLRVVVGHGVKPPVRVREGGEQRLAPGRAAVGCAAKRCRGKCARRSQTYRILAH